jgi:hypothetical protein
MIHSTVNILQTDCAFPRAFSISYLCYGMIITLFFANFYVQSYFSSNKKAKLDAENKRLTANAASGGVAGSAVVTTAAKKSPTKKTK